MGTNFHSIYLYWMKLSLAHLAAAERRERAVSHNMMENCHGNGREICLSKVLTPAAAVAKC
jgi:hypothetical protein